MAKEDIVVIGGSSGCQPVLQQIMADLPAEMPASIFITTHVPFRSFNYLPDILGGPGPCPSRTPLTASRSSGATSM